ncbi:glucose 1-dehydrogenase [Bacillaceae bacterium IKA-2]|nr:glucose 1-dehydrogenase [Bacillaceae bacterium IKA-2]
MKLNGKVAVVTGGASGIGEFTARAMANEGAKVVIADMNDELGTKIAQELNENAIYVHVNVTNEADVKKMIDTAVSTFGKVDILVNNAGIGSMSPTADQSLEEWSKVISVNLDGVFLVAKHALKAMRKNGGGSIVNIASILGHVGQAQTAAYSASKGGVVNFTRALAVEYAKENIRVNAVCPGYIDTPLLDQLDENMKNHLISLHPIGRLGRSEEVASAILFLASDDASFVTGANLLVDGGYTAQ